ncbi:type II toxin-antitoxin system ParD family antitoxin [Thiolapillus sp.]
MNVSLTPHFDKFIKNQLDSGRYHSASEMIRDALRLLEDREKQVNRLQNDLRQGMESGESTPLDIGVIKQKGRRRLAGHK